MINILTPSDSGSVLVQVLRYSFSFSDSVGKVFICGRPFCDSLEPPIYPLFTSLRQGSAIDEGIYPLRLQWSEKFQSHMPFILDVPGRSGIMLHPGNVVLHTQGCILLGELATSLDSGSRRLKNSKLTFDYFFDLVSLLLREVSDLKIEIGHM